MNPEISVIIPTFNVEDCLMDTVKSIMNQTIGFENIELILVDDNSSDNTLKIINDLSQNYENIISGSTEYNTGTASGPRNVGIEKSTTDFLMFLDSDDEFYPQMCEVMYNAITSNNIDVVTCRYDDIKNDGIHKPKSFLDGYPNIIKLNSLDEFPDIMSLGFTTMIWNKIFRKSLILENNIKFPVEHLYEDVYFPAKVYMNAKGILILNDFYGYKYNTRANESISQVFSESLVKKQLNGFFDIVNLIKDNKKYPYLWNETLVDLSKIYLYADLDKNYQEFFLNKMKPYYKEYKLNSRLHTASLPFNLLINIFIKLFSLSNSFAILTSNIYTFFKEIRK